MPSPTSLELVKQCGPAPNGQFYYIGDKMVLAGGFALWDSISQCWHKINLSEHEAYKELVRNLLAHKGWSLISSISESMDIASELCNATHQRFTEGYSVDKAFVEKMALYERDLEALKKLATPPPTQI